MPQIPVKLDTELFKALFTKANLSAMTLQERRVYEDSLKAYRDYHNTINTSYEDGKEEGREEGIEIGEHNKAIEIARRLLAAGMSVEQTALITRLSTEEVGRL